MSTVSFLDFLFFFLLRYQNRKKEQTNISNTDVGKCLEREAPLSNVQLQDLSFSKL